MRSNTVYFEQPGLQMTHNIKISRGADVTHVPFRLHFTDLTERYGIVHIVDLLSTGDEASLSALYTRLLEENPLPYTHFDFHAVVKRDNYERIDSLVRKLPLDEYGFAIYPSTRLVDPIMKQTGVFRVNCLDCLDRTNVVQRYDMANQCDCTTFAAEALFAVAGSGGSF